jgi:hypothetical protein
MAIGLTNKNDQCWDFRKAQDIVTIFGLARVWLLVKRT